jgi:very-short-patch-repair endonuclease
MPDTPNPDDTPPPFTSPDLWRRLKPLARQMRYDPTPAENRLWHYLRNRQIAGVKFRRQHAIDRFIVDFICLEKRLVIEVDGATHRYTTEEDGIRQEFLESMGLRVLRFSNSDVFRELDGVLEMIQEAVQDTSPPAPLSKSGEGESGCDG